MEGFCRGCLERFDEPTDLLQYCESNRRLFVYSTGLQVKRNDTFTFQICKECFLSMKSACKFKKQCRNSDKKLKNFLALKEDGESMDFCSYLKNVGDTLTLRLPIVTRSSTPRHQRNEDDNDSTCTSMQNFMTDMLEGEEMPPAEDRIIREVIQEEADILDDSLDSHWLQDDNMSIDTEFRMDFNYAMSTPLSINNDHCYTPQRFTDEKEEILNYYTSKSTIERCDEPKVSHQNDMPILDNCGLKFDEIAVRNIVVGDLENEFCIKEPNIAQNNDMPILDDCDIEFDGVVDNNITLGELQTGYPIESIKEPDKEILSIKEKLQNFDTFVQSKVTQLTAEDDPFAKLDSFKDNLFSVSNDISPFINSEKEETSQDVIAPLANENEISIILSTGMTGEKVGESPLTCELNYYMNKVKKTNDEKDIVGDKILNNEKDIGSLLNQELGDKTISQSPFTRELDQYINKAILKKAVNLESKSGGKELSIFKTGTVSTNDVQQAEKDICVILNQMNDVENVEDPIKRDLEHYVNKAKVKKKSKQALVNPIDVIDDRCSIDKNLESALKNDDSQEFSLDQLLVSPRVTIRSGASTPSISSILFGHTISKEKDLNLASKFEDTVNVQETGHCKDQSTPKHELIDVTETHEVIDKYMNATSKSDDTAKIEEYYSEFFKDNVYKPLSAERGQSNDQKPKSDNEMDKDTNVITNLEDIVKVPQIDRTDFIEGFLQNEDCKRRGKPMKGFYKEVNKAERKKIKHKARGEEKRWVKDIRKMKELVKFQHEDTDEIGSQPSDSIKDEQINVKEIINNRDDENSLPKEDIEDLNISLTDLLNADDNESLDLNFSISSDFLKEENIADSDSGYKDQAEAVFKKPFSPPDIQCDVDQYLCKDCNKRFRSVRALKIHAAKIHVKIQKNRKVPKVCQFCGKSFTDTSNFNKHVKSHGDSDTTKCRYCYLDFATPGRLSQHMRAHANMLNKKENKEEETKKENEKKFVCTTCGKTFKIIANYKIHQKRHTKSYTITCNICEKGFYRNEDLKKHMGSHSKEHAFECQFCPKVYRSRAFLMGHMYNHLDIKDFECRFCNVKFISKHLLQRHFATQSCIKVRDQIAEEAKEKSDGTQVSVTEVTGLSNLIEKVNEITKKLEGNSKDSETNLTDTRPSDTEDISTKVTESQPINEGAKLEPLERMEIETEVFLESDDKHCKSEPHVPEVMEES